MPKVGMKPIRRKEIIESTLNVIQSEGYDGATLRMIAKRAGLSAGLTHHYFGSKENLLVETLRYLLDLLKSEVIQRLNGLTDPDKRLSAMISGNFSELQLRQRNLSTWLVLYVQAQKSPEIDRMLRIYHRRVASNFASVYRAWTNDHGLAMRQGKATAALLDGLWLRFGTGDNPPSPGEAVKEAEHFIRIMVGRDSPPL